jgi:RnfABCDGE-type electron transport complex G subunit
MKNNIVKFAFILMVTAGLAIAGVAIVYGVTKIQVMMKKQQTVTQSLALAFNMTDEEFAKCKFAPMPEDAQVPECWEVASGGKVIGYAARGVSPRGYGGNVEVVAAFRPDTRALIGAAVTDVGRETPGLGQNATQKKPAATWLQALFGVQEVEADKGGKPLDNYVFMRQFAGKDEAKLVRASKEEEGIVVMSGSTITSLAVIGAVKNAQAKIREQLGKRSGGETAGEPAH